MRTLAPPHMRPTPAGRRLATWLLTTWLLTIGLTLPLQATAVELLDGRVDLNAYGTLGLSRASIDNPGYRNNYSYRYDVDRHWTSRMDNRLGVQLTAHLNPIVSFITQAQIRRTGDDEVKPQLTWAYLRWKPTSATELRLGRIRYGMFLIGDEFGIGYSQPWARPPTEFYTISNEDDSIEGLQLRYRLPLATYTLTLDAHAGTKRVERLDYTLKSKLNKGLAVTLANTHWTLRGMLMCSDVHLDSARVGAIHALIARQNTGVANDYRTDIDSVCYGGLGARYESDQWLLMSEYSRVRSPVRTAPASEAAYITLGHPLGDWMPYATLARFRVLGPRHEDRLTGLAARTANALLTAQNRDQSALSLGLRWDVRPGIALKAQADRVRPDRGAYGLQARPLPAGPSAFNVISFVMDWVY
jgi:hypothetical protein